MPENHTLTFNRPAFVKMNKSQIRIYSAALAIASRIWRQRFLDITFAEKSLTVSEKVFRLRNKINDFKDDEKYYNQNEFYSKLALGALEIFNATDDKNYLSIALDYGKNIADNYWWNWRDFNELVFYKLAGFDKQFVEKLKNILSFYKSYSDSNFFSLAHQYNWGQIILLLVLY